MAEPIAVLDAHGKHAQRAVFTADGETLVTCGQDACIRLWKVPSFAPDGAFEGHAASVNTLSFSADGGLLASGSSDGTVRIWSFPGGRELDVLDGQVAAAVSPTGGFATISTKARAVLWDGNYDEVATLPLLDRRLFSLAFTRGRRLAPGRRDGDGPPRRREGAGEGRGVRGPPDRGRVDGALRGRHASRDDRRRGDAPPPARRRRGRALRRPPRAARCDAGGVLARRGRASRCRSTSRSRSGRRSTARSSRRSTSRSRGSTAWASRPTAASSRTRGPTDGVRIWATCESGPSSR